MSVRIIEDRETGQCALYCSTTGTAFGHLIDTRDQADAFLEWLPKDAREYSEAGLAAILAKFLDEMTCHICGDVREEAPAEPETGWTCDYCVEREKRRKGLTI